MLYHGNQTSPKVMTYKHRDCVLSLTPTCLVAIEQEETAFEVATDHQYTDISYNGQHYMEALDRQLIRNHFKHKQILG